MVYVANEWIELCARSRVTNEMHITSDAEQDLLEVIVDVLETGFDLLTVNKEIFDIWQKVTMEADVCRKVSAGTVVGGVAGGAIAFLTGGSILGPLGVAAVGGILWAVSEYFHNKNSKEMNKIKDRTFFSRIPSAHCY